MSIFEPMWPGDAIDTFGQEIALVTTKEKLARFYNQCVSEDEDDWEDYFDWIVETKDPIEAFDGRNWAESTGKIKDDGTDTRFFKTTMFYFDKVQVRKGMPRTNLAVAEAGNVRLVIMGEGDYA